jgi:hypothetical protein
MNKLDSNSINGLISYIRENISVYAGKDDNRRVLIKPGLKISNKKTGFDYTVDNVIASDEGLLITCIRPPDVSITITSADLKDFVRA